MCIRDSFDRGRGHSHTRLRSRHSRKSGSRGRHIGKCRNHTLVEQTRASRRRPISRRIHRFDCACTVELFRGSPLCCLESKDSERSWAGNAYHDVWYARRFVPSEFARPDVELFRRRAHFGWISWTGRGGARRHALRTDTHGYMRFSRSRDSWPRNRLFRPLAGVDLYGVTSTPKRSVVVFFADRTEWARSQRLSLIHI